MMFEAPAGDVVCGFSLYMTFQPIAWLDYVQPIPPAAGAVVDGARGPGHAPRPQRRERHRDRHLGPGRHERRASDLLRRLHPVVLPHREAARRAVAYRAVREPFLGHCDLPTSHARPLVHEEGVSVREPATVTDDITALKLCWFLPDNPYLRPPSPDDAFLYMGFYDPASYIDPHTPAAWSPGTDAVGIPGKDVRLRLPSGQVVTSGEASVGLLGGGFEDDYFVVPANFRRATLLVDISVQPGFEFNTLGLPGPAEWVSFVEGLVSNRWRRRDSGDKDCDDHRRPANDGEVRPAPTLQKKLPPHPARHTPRRRAGLCRSPRHLHPPPPTPDFRKGQSRRPLVPAPVAPPPRRDAAQLRLSLEQGSGKPTGAGSVQPPRPAKARQNLARPDSR